MGSLKQMTLPDLANEQECTACLACENVCSRSAITHITKKDGHTYVQIDKDKCIGCLRCQTVCINSRECYGNNNLNASQIFAAWAKNKENRDNATSGGVFAAIADYVLENNGCVIGAELDGFSCKHTVIYRKEDISRLQGSKYMASSMEEVYEIVKKELPSRDVLFVGLGCQCAGVLAFLPEIKTTRRLYTVDLVCGGIPSGLLIERFREEYPEITGIVSFRTKEKYELKVQTEGGIKVLSERSLPLHGFNCGMTNRYSCYDCQFAKAHRRTDITLGDLWDNSFLPDEHKKGISMVIVHSDNGMKLLCSSKIIIRKIDWERALINNKRTVSGHRRILLPRKNIIKLYSSLNAKKFNRLFTMNIDISTPILFAFRAYRYIVQKKEAFDNRRDIQSILRKL